MGVLVTGALKVEEGLEQLKRDARSIGSAKATKANAMLKPKWAQVKNSLNNAQGKPIIERIELLPNQFEHDARFLWRRARFRTSAELTGFIERTIEELEKVKRKLEPNLNRGWAAA